MQKSRFSRIFSMATILACVMGLASATAQAQQLNVATGSKTGTYNSMFEDIKKFCGNELLMNGRVTTGGVQNLELLTGNKVQAIFGQSDMMYRRSRGNTDLADVKTLLAMHPEQLHFIVRSAPIKEGGYGAMGIKVMGTEVTLTEVAQLKGRKIAAWGGSVETAKQVRLDSEIAYDIIQVQNFGEAKKALDAQQVDAILMVGGAPMADIAGDEEKKIPALSAAYRLLAVGPATVAKLKDSYPRTDNLTYGNLNAQSVPTVSVEALFVTREYKTAAATAALSSLRNCVITKLDDIKEAEGTHPAWRRVSATNKGSWPYYNLPTAAATPAVAPAQPKKK